MTRAQDDGNGRNGTGQVELTEAEWDIMRVVWNEGPCAAGTVQESLQGTRNWAYSTVKTTMDRMVRKGLLGTHSIRNLQLFSAAVTENQARRSEVRKTLRRAFDGALTPMMQFLLEHEGLTDDELRHLREMLDEAPEGDG